MGTILIPGWLQKKELYDGFEVYDVWNKNLSLTYPEPHKYVVGHSIGANIALYNWSKNKNQRLILINPLLPKRSLLSWFWRWLNNITPEDVSRALSPNSTDISHLFAALRFDPSPILKEIPKENIVVIRGSLDHHFCDENAKNFIRSLDIKIIETETKHKWSKEYKMKIEQIMRNWS